MTDASQLQSVLRTVGNTLLDDTSFTSPLFTQFAKEGITGSSVPLPFSATLFDKVGFRLTMSVNEATNVGPALFNDYYFTRGLYKLVDDLTVEGKAEYTDPQTGIKRTVYAMGFQIDNTGQSQGSVNIPVTLTLTTPLTSSTADINVLIPVNKVQGSVHIVSANNCFMLDPASAQVTVQLGQVTISAGQNQNAFQELVDTVAWAFDLNAYLNSSSANTVTRELNDKLNIVLKRVIANTLQSSEVAKKFAAGFTGTGRSACTPQIGNACVKYGTPCGPGFVSLLNCGSPSSKGCCATCADTIARPCAALRMCFADQCPSNNFGFPDYEQAVDASGKAVLCENGARLCVLADKCRPPGTCVLLPKGDCSATEKNALAFLKAILPQFVPTASLESKLNSLLATKSFTFSVVGVNLTVSNVRLAPGTLSADNLYSACVSSTSLGCVINTYYTIPASGLTADITISNGSKATYQIGLGIVFSLAIHLITNNGTPSLVFDVSQACLYSETANLSVLSPSNFTFKQNCTSRSDIGTSAVCALLAGAYLIVPLLQSKLREIDANAVTVNLPSSASFLVSGLCASSETSPEAWVASRIQDIDELQSTHTKTTTKCSVATWIVIGVGASVLVVMVSVLLSRTKRRKSEL